jgi:hypothetical protein
MPSQNLPERRDGRYIVRRQLNATNAPPGRLGHIQQIPRVIDDQIRRSVERSGRADAID